MILLLKSIINKKKLEELIFFIFLLNCVSFFFVTKHIAFCTITLYVTLCLSIGYYILYKVNYNSSLFFYVLACLFLYVLIFVIPLIIHNERYGFAIFFMSKFLCVFTYSFLYIYIPIRSNLRVFITSIVLLFAVTLINIFSLKSMYIDIGFVEHYTKNGIIDVYIHPLSIHHHSMAIYIISIVMMVIISMKYYKPKRIVYIVIVLLIVFNLIYVIVSGARIGILGLLILILCFIIDNFKFSLYSIIITIFIFTTTITIMYYTNSLVRNRFNTSFTDIKKIFANNYEPNSNFSNRKLAFTTGCKILAKNLFTGVSYSKENDFYKNEYKFYCNDSNVENCFGQNVIKPHIQFFRFAVIIGLPLACLGFLIYLTMYFLFNNIYYKGFFIINLLYQFTDMPFFLNDWLYFYFIFLVLFVTIKEVNSKIE